MSRIKLFGIIPKKHGISSEEFHDHYRHPHGTMGRNISTLRGYFQSHQIHSDYLDENQNYYEAVAEIWLDNLADVESFREEPTLIKYIIDDELLFIDMDNLKFLAADEEVLVSTPDARDTSRHPGDAMWSPFNRPLSIKVLQFIGLNGNPAWASPEDKELGDALGAFRHVRCHPLDAVHHNNPVFLGARELWWPSLLAFKRGVSSAPEAFEKLIKSQPNTITMLVQSERWI